MSTQAMTTAASRNTSANFTRIICATDGSPTSLTAVEQALVLAPGATALIAAVVDPDDELHLGSTGARIQCEDALISARNRFGALETRLLRGRTVPTLVELARAERADLLAIGASDHSRLSRAMQRSAMAGLAHRVDSALLIAREHKSFPNPILLATDGSRCSSAAAELVGRIAADQRHAAIVLHVGGASGGSQGLAEQAVRIREVSGIEAALVVAEGNPAECIVDTAKRIKAGLVVVGARGVTGLRRLGSVSEHVADHCGSSVLIVHPDKEPST